MGGDPILFIGKNLHVIGTKTGTLLDTQKALELAARVSCSDIKLLQNIDNLQGLLKPIYEVYPIAKMPEAIEKLRSGKVAGRLVVDFNA